MLIHAHVFAAGKRSCWQLDIRDGLPIPRRLRLPEWNADGSDVWTSCVGLVVDEHAQVAPRDLAKTPHAVDAGIARPVLLALYEEVG